MRAIASPSVKTVAPLQQAGDAFPYSTTIESDKAAE